MVSRERFDWPLPEHGVYDGVEMGVKAEVITVGSKGIQVHPGAKKIMGLTTATGNLRGNIVGSHWVVTRIPGYPVVFLQMLPPGLVHGVKRGVFLDLNTECAYLKFNEGFYSRFGLIKAHYEFRKDFSISDKRALQGYSGGIFGFLCLLDTNRLSELRERWHRGRFARVRDKVLYIDTITATRIFAIDADCLNYSVSTEDGHIWISPNTADPFNSYQKLHSDVRAGYMYAEVPLRAYKAGLEDGYYVIDDFTTFENWGYNRLLRVGDDYDGIPEVLRDVL